jgi:LuxR family maltose regulon positive regulatory protein
MLLTGGRISQFQKWLAALPPGLLESRPVLLARHGQVLATQGETTRGLRYMDQALEHFQRTRGTESGEENDRQIAWIYVWRAWVHLNRGSHADTLADTAAALALVETQEQATNRLGGEVVDPENSWPRAEAYRIRGTCQRRLGRLDEAIRNFSISLRLYQEQGDSKSVNLVLINLGGAYLDSAEFGSSLSCYTQALDYYQSQNDDFSLSSVLNDVACLHHLRGEYTLAYTTFEDALDKAIQGANLRVQALVQIGIGDLQLDLQALDSALDSYHQARPITEQFNDHYLMIYLDLAEAAVARLKDNLHGAHLFLNAASQIIQQSPSDYFRSLHQLESGRLALAEHDYTQAANVLAQAAAGFTSGGQRIEAGRACLLLAAACFELGDLPAAEAHLAEMFQLVDLWESQHSLVPTARLVRPFLQQIAELFTNAPEAAQKPERILKPFGSENKPDPMLGRKALRLLDQVDQLESNMASLQRRQRRQSSIVAPSPPQLLIQALGQAKVFLRSNQEAKPEVKSGEKSAAFSGSKAGSISATQLVSADWQTQVTRDLFFLILSDSRGWTKEALGELLWPGSSPAQLKLRFKNTVYRLRRALQQDAILFEGDRYSFNRSLDYEYDVEQFWERLNQANEAATPKKKIKALQAAMQLYQGEYLPEVSGAWVLPEQERLRQAFLSAGLQLATLRLEAGQLDQALEVANRLINTDPYLEDAYLIAMQTQAAAGNRPAARRLYEKLSQTLAQELDATPSSQTEKLYQTLMD